MALNSNQAQRQRKRNAIGFALLIGVWVLPVRAAAASVGEKWNKELEGIVSVDDQKDCASEDGDKSRQCGTAHEQLRIDKYPQIRRAGNVLTVTPLHGKAHVFTDNFEDSEDKFSANTFLGYFRPLSAFIVEQAGYEWVSYTLINADTGYTVSFSAVPYFSPSGGNAVAAESYGGWSTDATFYTFTAGNFVESDRVSTPDPEVSHREWLDENDFTITCTAEGAVNPVRIVFRKVAGHWAITAPAEFVEPVKSATSVGK